MLSLFAHCSNGTIDTFRAQEYWVDKYLNLSTYPLLKSPFGTQCFVFDKEMHKSEYIDPHWTSPPLTPLIIIIGDVLWSDLHQYSG